MAKLTKQEIDGFPVPTDKEVFLWDDEIKKFGLRVKPSGVRTFLIQYRNKYGKTRRLSLGQYGEITPDQARKAAHKLLAAIRHENADPSQERADDRSAWTVKQLCESYLEAASQGDILGKRNEPKRLSTLAIDKGRITAHILPLLGNKAVKELTQQHIKSFYNAVKAGKTAKKIKSERKRGVANVKGGPFAAKRCVGLLQGILKYAKDDLGIITTNAAHGVQMLQDRRRKVAGVPEKLEALGRALDAARNNGTAWQAADAIELAALTGMRRGEVFTLRWSEVDMVSRVLHLSDSKTGESIRPLGRAAVDLLKSIQSRNEGGGYVFPAGRKESGYFGGTPRAFRRVISDPVLTQEDRDTLKGLSMHGLRHSYSTVADMLGLTIPTVGALIGHRIGGVTARYIARVDAVLITAADKVSAEVSRLMGRRITAQVVELKTHG